ncbi:histidine kinase dimerization/phospho-acceptor domain-containing protein [Methanoregula sp. PtaB.Bin085]|uniref:histidine kinase dimerization/phospho-acceptor domain-containing protein n=1 Tax=Methanoregula sp. PtaB.Bin085 TaxID=1811680 RepID=UPI003415BAE6
MEQKNAELARFTYTVSYELKSPLITIQGFAGLIAEESTRRGDSGELQTYVRRISSAVNTIDALPSDLLKLSRAGRASAHRNRSRSAPLPAKRLTSSGCRCSQIVGLRSGSILICRYSAAILSGSGRSS